jgi:hypothetical protein
LTFAILLDILNCEAFFPGETMRFISILAVLLAASFPLALAQVTTIIDAPPKTILPEQTFAPLPFAQVNQKIKLEEFDAAPKCPVSNRQRLHSLAQAG